MLIRSPLPLPLKQKKTQAREIKRERDEEKKNQRIGGANERAATHGTHSLGKGAKRKGKERTKNEL